MLGRCPGVPAAAELGDHSYVAYLRVDDVDAFHRRRSRCMTGAARSGRLPSHCAEGALRPRGRAHRRSDVRARSAPVAAAPRRATDVRPPGDPACSQSCASRRARCRSARRLARRHAARADPGVLSSSPERPRAESADPRVRISREASAPAADRAGYGRRHKRANSEGQTSPDACFRQLDPPGVSEVDRSGHPDRARPSVEPKARDESADGRPPVSTLGLGVASASLPSSAARSALRAACGDGGAGPSLGGGEVGSGRTR
jgi:hypothetical protein